MNSFKKKKIIRYLHDKKIQSPRIMAAPNAYTYDTLLYACERDRQWLPDVHWKAIAHCWYLKGKFLGSRNNRSLLEWNAFFLLKKNTVSVLLFENSVDYSKRFDVPFSLSTIHKHQIPTGKYIFQLCLQTSKGSWLKLT